MIRVAILTVSDSSAQGTRMDLSGPALQERCSAIGWAVEDTAIVPDDEATIARYLRQWSDGGTVSLILTTGGTGISARDNTPEATMSVVERTIPGIPELMRMKGLEQTKFSVLSRGMAGARGRTLIVNLPGSPQGAVHSLGVIEHLAPHVIDLLQGRTEHAGGEIADATRNSGDEQDIS